MTCPKCGGTRFRVFGWQWFWREYDSQGGGWDTQTLGEFDDDNAPCVAVECANDDCDQSEDLTDQFIKEEGFEDRFVEPVEFKPRQERTK